MNRVLICCFMALSLCAEAQEQSLENTLKMFGMSGAATTLGEYFDVRPDAMVVEHQQIPRKDGIGANVDIQTADKRRLTLDPSSHRLMKFGVIGASPEPRKESHAALSEEDAVRLAKNVVASLAISGIEQEPSVAVDTATGNCIVFWFYLVQNIRCGACVKVGVSRENGKVVQFLDNGPLEPPESLEPLVLPEATERIASTDLEQRYGQPYVISGDTRLMIVLPRKTMAARASASRQGVLAWRVQLSRVSLFPGADTAAYVDARSGTVLYTTNE